MEYFGVFFDFSGVLIFKMYLVNLQVNPCIIMQSARRRFTNLKWASNTVSIIRHFKLVNSQETHFASVYTYKNENKMSGQRFLCSTSLTVFASAALFIYNWYTKMIIHWIEKTNLSVQYGWSGKKSRFSYVIAHDSLLFIKHAFKQFYQNLFWSNLKLYSIKKRV